MEANYLDLDDEDYLSIGFDFDFGTAVIGSLPDHDRDMSDENNLEVVYADNVYLSMLLTNHCRSLVGLVCTEEVP
jgi:hypothetical protein